jgi:hypothetical protein
MCGYSSNIRSAPSSGKAQFLQAFCAQFRGNLSLLITGIMKWVADETKDSVGFRNCNWGQTTGLPGLHPDEIWAYAFLAFRLHCGTDTTFPFLSQIQESAAGHRFTLSSNATAFIRYKLSPVPTLQKTPPLQHKVQMGNDLWKKNGCLLW